MGKLSYVYTTNVIVKLDGRTVGTIREVEGGWQYFPKGSRKGGEVYGTQVACRLSLECNADGK